MHVDIFLLFDLVMTRNDRVLATKPIGIIVGSQYVPTNEEILNVKRV